MRLGERGVDDDDDVVEGVLLEEVADGFVQLRERRRGAAFGSDVGSVDDELGGGHLDASVKQGLRRKRRKSSDGVATAHAAVAREPGLDTA